MKKQEAFELAEEIKASLPNGFFVNNPYERPSYVSTEVDQDGIALMQIKKIWTFGVFKRYTNGEEKCLASIGEPEDWYGLRELFQAMFNQEIDRRQEQAIIEQEKLELQRLEESTIEDDTEKPFGSPSRNWQAEQADQDYMQKVMRGEE